MALLLFTQLFLIFLCYIYCTDYVECTERNVSPLTMVCIFSALPATCQEVSTAIALFPMPGLYYNFLVCIFKLIASASCCVINIILHDIVELVIIAFIVCPLPISISNIVFIFCIVTIHTVQGREPSYFRPSSSFLILPPPPLPMQWRQRRHRRRVGFKFQRIKSARFQQIALSWSRYCVDCYVYCSSFLILLFPKKIGLSL